MKKLFKILFYIFGTIGIVVTVFIAVVVYKYEYLSNPLVGRTYACMVNSLLFYTPETFKFYGDGTVDMDGGLQTWKYSFIKDGQAVAVHMPPSKDDPNGTDIIFTMPQGNKLEGKVGGIFPVLCKQVTDEQAAYFLKHTPIGGGKE
ncbi:hypothetical protein [Caldisericum sp.]|uniref:hypothetical protein n=1 Tax=Caldisericum sp. TaxID=2499687 RepID=UPI003D107B17